MSALDTAAEWADEAAIDLRTAVAKQQNGDYDRAALHRDWARTEALVSIAQSLVDLWVTTEAPR